MQENQEAALETDQEMQDDSRKKGNLSQIKEIQSLAVK